MPRCEVCSLKVTVVTKGGKTARFCGGLSCPNEPAVRGTCGHSTLRYGRSGPCKPCKVAGIGDEPAVVKRGPVA